MPDSGPVQALPIASWITVKSATGDEDAPALPKMVRPANNHVVVVVSRHEAKREPLRQF